MRKFFRKNIIFKTIDDVYEFLPPKLKRRSIRVILSLFVNAVIDLLGVALLFPIFSILINNDFLTNEYMKRLFDALGFQSRDTFFVFICIVVMATMIIKSVIYVYSKIVQMRFAQEVFEYCTLNNLDAVYNTGYSYVKKKNSNELLRDISHLPRTFATYIILPTFIIINELIVVTLIFSILIYFYSVLVVMIMIPMILVVYFFYRIVRKRLNSIDRRLHDIQPDNFKSILDVMHGYAEVSINNRYSNFRNIFATLVDDEKETKVKQSIYVDMPTRVVELGVVFSIVIIMSYCYFNIDSAEERLYLLGVFALAAYRSTPSLNKILTSVVKIKGKQFVIEVLDEWANKPKIELGTSKVDFKTSISIKGVSFSYGERKVLDDIDVEFKKGEITALFGPSGSGKSTIIKLITGLEKCEHGKVHIGDDILSNQNLISWREKVGYVGQSVHVLDDTLFNNIVYRDNNPDEENVLLAIKMAELGDMVKINEKGVHMPIGEGGNKISGGQMQRVGIARALYKQPEILLMDESTSSLDAKTERGIMDLIKQLNKENNLTVIIITHNAENLGYADKVYHINNGKISNEI